MSSLYKAMVDNYGSDNLFASYIRMVVDYEKWSIVGSVSNPKELLSFLKDNKYDDSSLLGFLTTYKQHGVEFVDFDVDSKQNGFVFLFRDNEYRVIVYIDKKVVDHKLKNQPTDWQARLDKAIELQKPYQDVVNVLQKNDMVHNPAYTQNLEVVNDLQVAIDYLKASIEDNEKAQNGTED